MSETLAAARVNVWELLREQDTNALFLDDFETAHLIMSRAQEVAGEMGLGHDWQLAAFTLTAGSLADYDITNPTNSEFVEVLKLRIAEIGHEIDRVSWDEIEVMREGLISTTGNGGDPSYFALRMDDANNVTVRINTVPSLARTMDVLRSILPANTYTDATVLPFGSVLLRGIEKAVASEIIDRMPDQQLVMRKLSRATGQRYQADFERAKETEKSRLHRLKVAKREVGASWR